MSDSSTSSGGQAGSGSKEVFAELLKGEELTLLKNRSLFNEFLSGFRDAKNPYNSNSKDRGERFLEYRYRLYHNLSQDEEMISRAQLAVIVSEVSILSLEAFTRASFDFSEFYKKTPPDTLSAEDLQAVLEGDASRTTAALNHHFSLPDEADYQLRLQGKLAITHMAAKFGFLVATSAASASGSRALYDQIFSIAFSVADELIMKSAAVHGAYVYEDDFKKLLLEEASQFAKDTPSYMLSDEMGFEERTNRIKQRFQQMRQDNFLERVRKAKIRETDPDALKGAEDGEEQKRGLEEDRLVIHDVEKNQEVEIPDLQGKIMGGQEALNAGKTIMDYLRNLQIGGVGEEQEVAVTSGDSGGSDDDETEEREEELDTDIEYEVFIDSNKRRMKKAEVQAAASHGQQVAFLSAKQMQKFNQSTNHAYAKNVSLYNTSRKESRKLEAPMQAQSQTQQQNKQKSKSKKFGWFGFGRSKDEDEKKKEKSSDKPKDKEKSVYGKPNDDSKKKSSGKSGKSGRQERREERKLGRQDARDRRFQQLRKQLHEVEHEFDEQEEKLAKEKADKQKNQKKKSISNEQKNKVSGMLKDYVHDMKDTHEIQGHESNTSRAEREKQKNPEIKR